MPEAAEGAPRARSGRGAQGGGLARGAPSPLPSPGGGGRRGRGSGARAGPARAGPGGGAREEKGGGEGGGWGRAARTATPTTGVRVGRGERGHFPRQRRGGGRKAGGALGEGGPRRVGPHSESRGGQADLGVLRSCLAGSKPEAAECAVGSPPRSLRSRYHLRAQRLLDRWRREKRFRSVRTPRGLRQRIPGSLALRGREGAMNESL